MEPFAVPLAHVRAVPTIGSLPSSSRFIARSVNETAHGVCCATNFSPQPSDGDVRRCKVVVYAQDNAIVETHCPERVPVDLRYRGRTVAA
jgi:hypothetical protein